MKDSAANHKDSLALRSYLAFSHIATPLYHAGLKLRLKRGKEHPDRYREKLGYATHPKPDSEIIWLHGVGLGEVLALRSLIRSLHQYKPEQQFLVTSSTRASAEVFNKHCPDNTVHQFLPVDAKAPVMRFLNHWQPVLSVWAEQDLWPAMVYHTSCRHIPLALVNARMNQSSYQSRARAASLYRDLYHRFAWVSAQDHDTALHLRQLGADASVGGSLKASAVQLADNKATREQFEQQLGNRPVWLLASSHVQDEALAIQTHRQLLEHTPDALLIIAPRLIDRKPEIINAVRDKGLSINTRSDKQHADDAQVYLADTFGEMGLWYRVSHCALIGGSNSDIQGHNPWEAAALHCAIAHGPNTDNFGDDYQSLHKNNAAVQINNPEDLTALLIDRPLQTQLADNALRLAENNNRNVDAIALQLLKIVSHQREC